MPSRRRVSIFVDVKSCASSRAGTCAGLINAPSVPPHCGGEAEIWCLVAGGVIRPPGLGGVKSCLDLLRHPETRGPRPRVGRALLGGGTHYMLGDDAKGSPVAAGTDWLLGGADAVLGLDDEE